MFSKEIGYYLRNDFIENACLLGHVGWKFSVLEQGLKIRFYFVPKFLFDLKFGTESELNNVH